LQLFISCFRAEAAIHPDIEVLISFCDGELNTEQFASVVDHIAACDSCSVECRRLRAARDAGPVALPAHVLTALRARVQELMSERAALERSGDIQQKVAAALAPFLGPVAAHRLLVPFSGNGKGLLPAVEPVLSNFLGEHAAAELVSHLIDTAMGDA
jgi:anti-sigma factor RsiW